MKKLISYLLIVFCLLLNSCSNKNNVSIFGDLSSSLVVSIDYKYINYCFSYDRMTSNDLYKIVNKNAKSNDGKKEYILSEVVKKSQKIIISVGLYDFFPLINFENFGESYKENDTQIERQKEILIYNLTHTLEEIHLINKKVKIYLLSPYFFSINNNEVTLISSFFYNLYLYLNKNINYKDVSIIPLYEASDEQQIKEEIMRVIYE